MRASRGIPRAAGLSLLFVLVCLLFCAACARERPRSPETIAVIDGKPVALASFRRYFEQNAGRPIAESSPAVVSGIFDQFLREETWLREAGLAGGDESSARREAPGALLARAGASARPTDADVREEYDRHPDRFERPEEARAARLFVRTKDEAVRARARALAGEDFGELARAVSKAPDGTRGGALGWIRRGDLPSEFEEAIFRLRPGEVSPAIPAEEGFLIFKLLERRLARRMSPEEAAPEIRERLAREKADRYLDGVIESARRAGRVRVFPGRLPFVYTGKFLPEGKES